MGKTTAANMLRSLRIPVFDSDKAAHSCLAPDGKAFETVALAFPECWDKKNHIIDRKKLGERVFHDDEARKTLEHIIHPLVWSAQKQFLLACRKSKTKYAVLDIPLLYETGSDRKCDVVFVVTAPYLVQRQRVLSRPAMTEEKFLAILEKQLPDSEKCRRADVVIRTGLGRAATLKQLKQVLETL